MDRLPRSRGSPRWLRRRLRRQTGYAPVLWGIATFLLASLVPAFSFPEGKGHGIEVRLTSPKLVEASPGTVVTASFLVTNHTAEREEVWESAEAAGTLQLVSPAPASLPLSGELDPRESEPRIVAVAVPAGCPAGPYQVRYEAGARRHPALSDADSFTVVVAPVQKLQVMVWQKPDGAIAGDPYSLEFRVLNRGNVAVDLDFTLTTTPDSAVALEPRRLALPAGASGVLRAKVLPPGDLRTITSQSVVLRGRQAGLGSQPTLTSQTVVVRVLPRMTGTYDPYNRLPVRLTLGTLGAWGPSSALRLWFEASGSGTIDEAGSRHVDFFVRAPDTRRVERFGLREEYHLAYRDPNWTLRLGDAAFSLSPLTESVRWGRGAQGTFTYGKGAVGLLHVTDPDGTIGPETGGFLSYQLLQAVKLQANVLRKEATGDWKGPEGTLYSLQAAANPGRWLTLGVEYGMSEGARDGQSSRTGSAYRVDVAGLLPRGIQYSLQKIRAGRDYFGYYHESDTFAGDVVVPLTQRLRGHVSLRGYENNLSGDGPETTAARERFAQAGLSYNLGSANARLEYERLSRRDELTPSDYDYTQKLVRLGLGLSGRPGSVQAYAARGVLEDRVTGSTRDDLEQYSVYAHVRPTDKQTYSLFARTGHDGFTGSPQRTKSVGVDATWLLPGPVRASLGWRRDDPQHRSGANQGYANLVWERPNGQALNARFERTQGPSEDRSAGYISYSVPFGIPVSKKRSIGALRGRVHEGGTPDAPGIPGAIVYVEGATAVTDARGEFLFPALKPGSYQLFVDAKSIGLGRVPTLKLPKPVAVRPAEEERIDIGVVAAARLCGRVLVSRPEGAAPVRQVEGKRVLLGSLEQGGRDVRSGQREGLENLLLELSDGDEVRRELTDASGLFCFRDLRPGTWTLRPRAEGVPAQHEFEHERLSAVLSPGSDARIEIKVVPKTRTIQMLEEGEITPSR